MKWLRVSSEWVVYRFPDKSGDEIWLRDASSPVCKELGYSYCCYLQSNRGNSRTISLNKATSLKEAKTEAVLALKEHYATTYFKIKALTKRDKNEMVKVR